MKKVLIAALAILSFAACNKTVQELPPATQTGANTFGASVDGNFWIPKSFGPIVGNDILQVRIIAGQDFYINARNYAASPTETEFEIFLQGVTAPGTYQLAAPGNYAYYVKRKLTPIDEWKTTATYTGTVTITKVDLVERILAGTFQFTAANIDDASRQLTVTEGRFDIKIP